MKETNKYVKPTGCLYLLDYFYVFFADKYACL